METFHRLAVPAFVVIFLTASVLVSFLSRPERMNFEELLEELKITESPQPIWDEVRHRLTFQENGVKPEKGATDARAVADLYYRAANALNARKEEAFRETVFELFEKSVSLFPAVSHGWPYYLMAEIRQSQERWPEAQELYRNVILYDYSDLSLKAGFWVELLNHWQGKPVDPRPVYAYYRYGDQGRVESLQPFRNAIFEERPESLAIQALIGDASASLLSKAELLDRYQSLRPDDYAALYVRGDSLPPWLPKDGHLQDSVYALHAQQNGHLRIMPEGEARVDFYAAQETVGPLTIQFELQNPFQLRGQIEAYHNNNFILILDYQNPQQTLTVTLTPTVGRNLLTLHFRSVNEIKPSESPWVEIEDLHIVLPETTP